MIYSLTCCHKQVWFSLCQNWRTTSPGQYGKITRLFMNPKIVFTRCDMKRVSRTCLINFNQVNCAVLKDTTESNTSASYLDLLLSIGRDGQLQTSLYDKRDDFNFHITNFPFLSSNIPSSPAYGVFISQLIRYARACSSYECFILRAVRLSNKLLGQGYVKECLRSSLRKFYGRYGDLIKQYGVPLSRMLHDILDYDNLQWHPPLIRHYTNFWPYYWSWPYNRIWLFT